MSDPVCWPSNSFASPLSAVPPVRLARRHPGGHLQEGEHHIRVQLGGHVAERAPPLRRLQRLLHQRVGHAEGRARRHPLRPREQGHVRAGVAGRRRPRQRQLGLQHKGERFVAHAHFTLVFGKIRFALFV